MMTARTGTVFNLANGERDRSVTPASAQAICGKLAGSSLLSIIESRLPAFEFALAIAGGIIAAAVAINLRRDSALLMAVFLPKTRWLGFNPHPHDSSRERLPRVVFLSVGRCQVFQFSLAEA